MLSEKRNLVDPIEEGKYKNIVAKLHFKYFLHCHFFN